jgi:hypothetical protein
MRKSRTLLASLALSALVFTGCSSVTDMFSQSSDTGSIDSESVISGLNNYTDLINGVHEQMQILDSDTVYFESDMNDYANITYEPTFTCNFNLADRASLEAYTANPSGLEDAESQDLIAQASAIFATVDKTTELCKDLSKYVTAQNFKTDDFAQGQTLVADLYTNIDAYYEEHNKMLETLDTLYDKYDTFTVDETDPNSVGIDNMNKDLDMADAMLTMIEDSVSAGTFDASSELQDYYDSLSGTLIEHSGDNGPTIDSAYSADYIDFYNTLEVTFLPTVERSIRDMDNQDSDSLTNDYYDVLDGYNSMVDSYNYFLDASGY